MKTLIASVFILLTGCAVPVAQQPQPALQQQVQQAMQAAYLQGQIDVLKAACPALVERVTPKEAKK